MAYLLLHSPLLAAAATWGTLPERLPGPVLTPEITADGEPPFAGRYVADLVAQVAAVPDPGPLIAVAHSGAGPLLPAAVEAIRQAGRSMRAAVFLDAGLPAAGATRMEMVGAESAEAGAALQELLTAGDRFPNWTIDLLATVVPEPRLVLDGVRFRGSAFFTEPLPPTPLQDDLPCGYVQLSDTYAGYADHAEALGWPVARANLTHFGPLTDPDAVVALLDQVGRALPLTAAPPDSDNT